jgi:hypothetical protein
MPSRGDDRLRTFCSTDIRNDCDHTASAVIHDHKLIANNHIIVALLAASR